MQDQFDELLHERLNEFQDDPDEGLIDRIHRKKDRVISLYRILPFIASVIAIIALTGILMFSSGDESKPQAPAATPAASPAPATARPAPRPPA